jgi:hypothetical protein
MLLTSILLSTVLAGSSAAAGLAAGPFGGWNFTIVQDDAGGGVLYGLRGKVSATPAISVEPWFTMITEGDVDHDEEGVEFTQEGGSIMSFGVNASLGGFRTAPGFGLYATAGIGAYMLKPEQDYKEDQTRVGINFGPGFVVKIAPTLDLDVSGRFTAITLEGGGSRKSVAVVAGLNYYFGL